MSLLSRLKNWTDNESWTVFFDTYWRVIFSAGIKAGLSEAEAEDVVQETIVAVAKNIPDFKYDPAKGSFKAWLLNLTSWRIKDQLRRRHPEVAFPQDRLATSTATEPVNRVPDPAGPEFEAIWDQEWDRNIMEVVLEKVKRKVDAKQYQAFDLYVLREWPVSRVAHALNITRGMVYLAKHRINRLVKKEILALKARPI